MMYYDVNEGKVFVTFNKRKGVNSAVKRLDFEPIHLISDFGNKKDPYFIVAPDDFPGWFEDFLKFDASNSYSIERYPNDGVIIFRQSGMKASSKALFYRQHIEHFILNIFNTIFVPNEKIDYMPYRDQLLNCIEVVGWNLFNNAEKLKSQHNIKVEYDINNPQLIGGVYFDMFYSHEVDMEVQVAAFIETLIDDTDYLNSGEDEDEFVQSILTMSSPDVKAEDVEVEECDDEPVIVAAVESTIEEVENETISNDTKVEPVIADNSPFTIDVQVEQTAIQPVTIDVAVDPVTAEIEPVTVDVAVEPVIAEIEPVTVDVAVDPVTAEIEPVTVDVAVEPVIAEIEPVTVDVAVEPVTAEIEPVTVDVAVEPVTAEIEPVTVDVTVEPVTAEIEPVTVDVAVEPVIAEIEPVTVDVAVEPVTAEIEPFLNHDDDFDLFMLNAENCVAPTVKKGRKSKAKTGLNQNTLF